MLLRQKNYGKKAFEWNKDNNVLNNQQQQLNNLEHEYVGLYAETMLGKIVSSISGAHISVPEERLTPVYPTNEKTAQELWSTDLKSKEYIYNYVDRVRFAESSFPDYKCPSRGSGWRHNKSISHLDLATSCHSAAAGLSHWSSSHQTRHHQLRHSRSLDYNHIDRCKDALDIAEYYWRGEPEPEIYDEEEEEEIIEAEHSGPQQQQQQQQLKYVSEHHLTQHYRDFKCADENYHHSTNNIYQSTQQLQQQQQQQLQQQQQQQHLPRQQNLQQQQHHSNNNSGSIPTQQQQQQLQQFEFASDSCSLRRSRSLAVIREETFSDLQISSSNGSRRSQLIPRARLVNRGYFRERERLICGNNNKHHHHHHTSSREKLTTNCNCNNSSGCNTTSAVGGGGGGAGQVNVCYCQDLDEQSTESVAETCDSHQQQLLHHKQQQQQQHLHYHPHYHEQQSSVGATSQANDYYEHLKRLDKLALGLVAEQLHPWHNDKSDLESLNSDYFKNSLHQTNDLKQHHQQQHSHQHPHQQQLEFESYDQAIHLLAQDKPRIYQSRRQKRSSNLEKSQKFSNTTPVSGGESCPENSQSSVFPETTTSNSEDQTDSASLSEQEYDITKIEEIFQKTQVEAGDEENYEIISLTTTTRTRFETTEDEGEYCEDEEYREQERDCLLEEQINRHKFFNNTNVRSQEVCEGGEEVEDTEESNRHTTTDTEVEGTLKRARAVSDNLQKIIAYDSVYLSSEESSDSTLIDVDGCDTSLEVASLCTCIDEVETLLHISIEDAIYEPKAKQHKFEVIQDSLLTQPESVSFVETVNTKIEILDHCDDLVEEDIKPIYTQILKIEHTPSSSSLQQHHTTTIPAGVTSSAASKPKILSVVEKRKLKRYSDSAYSSNVSDSSEKALTPPTISTSESSLSGSSVYALSSHLKRQVAEPLYIPLKTNLSDNQYHSLPDVNIGQCLKVSESIDAQLRSSYNLDNYCSLDDTVDDYNLQSESIDTITSVADEHDCENNKSNCQQSEEEVVTTEEIYDSIKRFGRAHQVFKQKESQELKEEQQQKQEQVEIPESWSSDNSLEFEERDKSNTLSAQPETPEISKTEEQQIPQLKHNNYPTNNTKNIEISFEHHLESIKLPNTTNSSPQNYDSLEKPKEAPGIEIENFSQLIERRAKEIRASGRRTQLQQIEFANRAKFRLENTLSHYEDIQEETKENKYNINNNNNNNNKLLQNQATKNSLFRIVVTDAQNNIIEEDSIERRLETKEFKVEEEKENFNLGNIKPKIKSNHIENSNELLMVKFSRERIKEKQLTTSSVNSRTSGSLKRVPSKHKRQQYPISNTQANPNQHLSIAEAKKLLLSPKSKERRVLSNQIYRARPVKVITTTTTTTTTTSTDSFRRNKIKHQSNKMSRPQILQVIDNKRKLENGLTVAGNSTSNSIFNSNQIFQNTAGGEGNQVENEYLKKVDAVRCYWSKLVNSEQQQQPPAAEEEEKEIKEKEHTANSQQENKLLNHKNEELNEQQEQQPPEPKEQIFYMKQSKKTNDTENLNETQSQQQHQEQRYEEKKQFILGAQTKHLSSDETDNHVPFKNVSATPGDSHGKTLPNQDDYCSFMPSIEIVELDGDKKATIVSAVPSNLTSLGAGNDANDADIDDASEPQFDHIRYKVLKSQQLLRSNVLARNKKEAQFDGLIQYLQEYSFQELLSNNNVVIVEPVRTKIERPIGSNNIITGRLAKDACTMRTTTQCSQNEAKRKQRNTSDGNINSNVHGASGSGGNGGSSSCGGSGGGIKRHFFYQPVRVNRELYEEELPNPDTVRNVRKFFEEHILPTPGQGLLTKATTIQQHNNGATTTQTSPKSRRARKYRYLTIDTSYGHAATATNKQSTNSPQRKWDSASLSSGISSGDLSSPCECNDMENNQKSTVTDNPINDVQQQQQNIESKQNNSNANYGDGSVEVPKPIHVQDVVRKHNSCNTLRKTRSSAYGVPVRSSGIRPRSAIYGSLHKSSKSSNYRDIYEYHIKHAYHDPDEVTANDGDADEDEDDNDLFGDIDDDEDDLCDTYYVSNDVLRKIRECGSSVTYYGGRVVQTTSTTSAAPANTLESNGCGHNNGNNFNNTFTNNTNTKNPTMMTQTQTRARVREIETCCNRNASVHDVVGAQSPTICSIKAGNNNNNNECPHHLQGKQLEQKKFHLIKQENVTKNVGVKTHNQTAGEFKQNNVKHKTQGYKGDDVKDDYNTGGGITFKLVKSNSCSSRLELAGTTDNEPEETEVVRKMVHHFEATKNHNANNINNRPTIKTANNETTLTINNQTCLSDRQNNEVNTCGAVQSYANREGQMIEEKYRDCDIKLVTVNNHINIAKGNFTETMKFPSSSSSAATAANEMTKRQLKGELEEMADDDDVDENVKKMDEPKMYHTEAKDIHLDNGGGSSGGSSKDGCNANTGTCVKICRNKNVDLAFTFVKQPSTTTAAASKSSGINVEITKNNKEKETSYSSNSSATKSKEEDKDKDNNANKKLVTYENTLLPTITATTRIKNSNKMLMGDLKIDETSNKLNSNSSSNAASIHNTKIPSQIIVPVEIHCVDTTTNTELKQMENIKTTTCSSTPVISTNTSQSNKTVTDEKSFLPLSTASSVTSVIDKTVVKHYVANDKSIYEKRKYDDIEFEEFEIYDPTKDFEKLIEDEKKRNNNEQQQQNFNNYDESQQQSQQHSTTSSLSSNTSKVSATSSMAKSQQTIISTETETDCYDSLDDKL
ncbi:javelin [Cochliomyia hominivorax]